MLNTSLNKAHVGGNHCWLTIPYVSFFSYYWEHVKEQFENFEILIEHHGNLLGTQWEHFENPKIPKNQNNLEINIWTIPKNKLNLALAPSKQKVIIYNQSITKI
jgi:hypothetical protein